MKSACSARTQRAVCIEKLLRFASSHYQRHGDDEKTAATAPPHLDEDDRQSPYFGNTESLSRKISVHHPPQSVVERIGLLWDERIKPVRQRVALGSIPFHTSFIVSQALTFE